MFKANELKAELVRMGITIQDLANILGITTRSCYNKLNELNDWNYKELVSFKTLLGQKKFDYIFFEWVLTNGSN